MLRLKSFRAKNLRSWAEVEITDLPDIVLFYGDNDSGKSNLLLGITLLGQMLAAVLADPSLADGRPVPSCCR